MQNFVASEALMTSLERPKCCQMAFRTPSVWLTDIHHWNHCSKRGSPAIFWQIKIPLKTFLTFDIALTSYFSRALTVAMFVYVLWNYFHNVNKS